MQAMKILVAIGLFWTTLHAQTIVSMNPRNLPQNSPAITLNISGSGFKKGMKTFMGPVQLQTKIVSSTSVTASIPSSYLTAPGLFPVKVGNSNTLNLQVCAPLVIPQQTLPEATVGVPYSYQLIASGGCQPNP